MNEKRQDTIQLNSELFNALQYAAKTTLMQIDIALEENGLSGAKLYALSYIDGQGIGITQLADAMNCGKSNATQIVDRMVSEDVVERVPNPDDRRSVIVRLTEGGRTQYQAALKIKHDILNTLLDDLSDEEKLAMHGILERISGFPACNS